MCVLWGGVLPASETLASAGVVSSGHSSLASVSVFPSSFKNRLIGCVGTSVSCVCGTCTRVHTQRLEEDIGCPTLSIRTP